MHDDVDVLDLTVIDQRHDPDPEFCSALQRRVAEIVRGGETAPDTRELIIVELASAEDPSGSPRPGRASRVILAAIAAAAIVAAIAVIISRDDPIAPTYAPSGTVTVATTQPPTSTAALPTAPSDVYGARTKLVLGSLDPGTYAYLDVDRQGFNVRFTVPAGWTWNGRYLSKGGIGPPDGAAIFFFGGSVDVYADPCQWGRNPAPWTSRSGKGGVVDDLAAQPMRNATTPSNRPASGAVGPHRWAGSVVELTVPDNIDFARCDGGQFRSWGPENNVRSHQGPGQRDLVWSVDIDGAGVTGSPAAPEGGLVIDAASFPGTPTDVMSEIEAILASIAVGHWG